MENNNTLAKISLGLSVVLLICVIILFFRSPGSSSSDETTEEGETKTTKPNRDTSQGLQIAFYYQDSVNAKAEFLKEVEKELAEAQADAEGRLAGHQKKMENFEKKWSKKGRLLSTEQEQYMREGQELQQRGMQLQQELQATLAQQEQEAMMGAVQRIANFAETLAQEDGYDMIFGYQLGQNPTYIDPRFNVTSKLIKLLNDDYRRSTNGSTGVEESGD